jgi:hypothetical protein
MRAETARDSGGHRAMHAVLARSIVRGTHHTTPVRIATNDHRLSGERGVIENFHSSEEAIEIAAHDTTKAPRSLRRRCNHDACPF